MTPSPRSGRSRRFALPEHDDQRANEAIDALLGAPAPRRRRAKAESVRPAGVRASAVDPLAGLDSRLEWNDALRREEARVRRYHRPAAVAVVAIVPSPEAKEVEPSRLARPVAHVLRRSARETDRIARVSDDRFHVLLPETSEVDGRAVLDRVLADCQVWVDATGVAVSIVGAVAGSGEAGDLEGALATADGALKPVA